MTMTQASAIDWPGASVKAGRTPYRRVLLEGDLVQIEDYSISAIQPAACGYNEVRQIALPYSGGFEWRTVGAAREIVSGDMLLVQADEAYSERHLDRQVGHASLIITPSEGVIDAFSRPGRSAARVFSEPPRPSQAAALIATYGLLNRLGGRVRPSRLFAEEAVLDVVARCLRPGFEEYSCSPAALARARAALHEPASRGWSLTDLGAACEEEPVALALGFRRAEGRSLDAYRRAVARKSMAKKPARLEEDRIVRVLRHIDGCYAERCGLDDLASVAGWSRFHFLRTFDAALGITPVQYLIAARLRIAATELSTSAAPITEIALGVGFNDISHFNSSFRNAFGMAPGEWRRSHSPALNQAA